ncbi:MAG TPA: cytochrome c [Gemmataceae bacterium]|nr:cytochrome c [Gemmataceae bacterium]
MKTHLRLFGVGTAALALGVWFLAAVGSNAADDGDVRGSVRKLATALEKKDADAKKQAAAIAEKIEGIEEVMNMMSPRRGNKGGEGVGNEPNKIRPDGIEAKIMALAKKPLTNKELEAEAAALERMAYIAAAIGEVAHAKPQGNGNGKKKKKDWLTWSQEMNEAALELAAAAKKKDAAAIKTAASKVEAKCTSCHDVFKD